eukprot:3836321-Prymnesium_polylepis.1
MDWFDASSGRAGLHGLLEGGLGGRKVSDTRVPVSMNHVESNGTISTDRPIDITREPYTSQDTRGNRHAETTRRDMVSTHPPGR